ncbi:MAG: type II toxin-antitoxin system HipA family toxin [Cyclobacteriaceae bacterium]
MKLKPVEILNVFIWLGGEKLRVGRMAQVSGRIYFEYETEFLKRGVEISPFKLPLQAGAMTCESQIFEGVFGVFNDSLPDGWGRLLLDRAVQARGIAHQSLSPLDRLAHVGRGAMGALEYEPDYSIENDQVASLRLNDVAHEIQKVLKGEPTEVLQELLAMGGSSAGARPKILVGYNKNSSQVIHGLTELPREFEPWLIKFSSSLDQPDIARIEYAYALMAKVAGVEMPEVKLFEESGRKAYFGVKRFDRIGNRRIHMHSVAGLLHADHRVPSLDYEGILRCALALTRDITEVTKVWRLAAFNVLAHNRDDHSKNFSFLMDRDGHWKFSPAYDLTFSYGPGGEHSTMVFGEGRNPGSKELLSLGEKFQIKNAKEELDKVRFAVSEWSKYAEIAGVSKESKGIIQKRLVQIG